jgi:hypothetical protein
VAGGPWGGVMRPAEGDSFAVRGTVTHR